MKPSYGFTNSYRTFVVPINFILQLNLLAFAVYCCFFLLLLLWSTLKGFTFVQSIHCLSKQTQHNIVS